MRVISVIHQTLLEADYKLCHLDRKNGFVCFINDGRDHIETAFYCFTVFTVLFTVLFLLCFSKWSKQGAAKSIDLW